MSQKDAVKAALEAGVEKPQEIVDWVKSNHNIEMSKANASTLKSQLKNAKAPVEPASTTFQPTFTSPAAPVAVERPSGASVPLTDLETVKDMVFRHGVDGVKRLAELFR